MRRKKVAMGFLLALCVATANAQMRGKLIWSDEFNAPDGSAPDAGKWTLIDDGTGFGNHELEHYTPRAENARIEHGMLTITARAEKYAGHDGAVREYTSARLESRGKFETRYGRVEARIKLPVGQGIWPAFWMLGANFAQQGWPACGEIDIMEHVNLEPRILGSLHGPGYAGSNPLSGTYAVKNLAELSEAFHVYAVEWEPGAMRFYVDDQLYETRRATQLDTAQRWAFDHPFYLVLNVAVGGYWPGAPDATTRFPASMLVDYVRVYARPH